MIKNFNLLADRLKGVKVGGEDITPEKLLALLKDDKAESELTIPKVNMIVDEELETLKESVKKTGYEEGKQAGSEMFAKELKKKFGIEKDGKSLDTVFGYIHEKVLADAKIEPDKKIKDLSESLERLQKQAETDKGSYETKINELTQTITQRDIDFFVQSTMPQLTGIKPNQALALYKLDRQLSKDDNGNIVILKGGQVLKDKMEKPIEFTSDFSEWAKENGWMGNAGRGGGNDPGGHGKSFKSMDEVFKYMETNKIDPDSETGRKLRDDFNKSKV